MWGAEDQAPGAQVKEEKKMPPVPGASSLRGRVQTDTGKGSEKHEGQSQMEYRGAGNRQTQVQTPALCWYGA